MQIKSPAKINLFLHITGRRPDGYHNLLSLMCGVSLYDDILLESSVIPGITVKCDHGLVPEDTTNLAYRAADLFFGKLGHFPALPGASHESGLQISIDKKIPVAAGLGGGSSNAATVLAALNEMFGQPFSFSALNKIGLSLGADVPFFLLGRPAIAEGVGEQLTPYEKLKDYTVILVCPDFSVSTAWVYKNLNLRLTKEKKKLSRIHFDGRFFSVPEHLVNDLEPVTERAFPVIREIKRLLLAHGAAGAMMSGSGSTVFGLFAVPDEAISAYTALCNNQQSNNWALYVADLLI